MKQPFLEEISDIFVSQRASSYAHSVCLLDRHMGETRGPLANRCLGVLRELLHMLADSWTQLGSEIREFLEGIYRATTAISTMAISMCSESVMSCRAM